MEKRKDVERINKKEEAWRRKSDYVSKIAIGREGEREIC